MQTDYVEFIVKSIFVGVFVAFGIASLYYPPKARWIPLIISVAGFIVSFLDVLLPVWKKKSNTDGQDQGQSTWEKYFSKKELIVWGWIGIFFCFVMFLGMVYGSVVFLFFFIKLFWKEKLTLALVVSVTTGICIYLLFYVAFQMELYKGLLFTQL